ncbi:alpha/beta hydrolase [Trebonia kvetii]|uniref:Alpha/beta hydrolase n=1 Tax=Trebonia kvetii TaxID=2480626 RepID=A0A6P2C8H2_9ACTN|nr:alpha/beta hydrolase [Trebonia kvetii]TVZ06805.1 alpha/beta hydrolase [Trebonia kvetii]
MKLSLKPRLARARIITGPVIGTAAAGLAAGLAAISLVAASAQAAPAAGNAPVAHATASAKPVIVLEHGAWADASSWDRVIARLAVAGYTVYAPPNPLRGLPSDSAYLHDFLTKNPALAGRKIVLVGHSCGGAVITNAAVGDPAVKALVYVDAFIPAKGQTVDGLLGKVPGSCIGGNPASTFLPVPYPGAPKGAADLYLQPQLFPDCFASGVSAAQLAATQRPLSSAAVTQPSGTPAWAKVPSWAVVGTGDKVIPPAELLAMANRAHAHVAKVKAGHLSLISAPDAVARVIIQATTASS